MSISAEKKRVLHIILRVGGGGLAMLLMNAQKELANRYQFDFLVSYPGDRAEEARGNGSVIHVLPPEMQSPLHWAKAVGNIVAEHHYDIVHFHRFGFGGSVMRAAKRAGAKVRIAHSHHTLFQESNLLQKILYCPYHWTVNRWLLLRNATNIVGCSSDALRFLMGAFWKAAKCKVILNGIPIEPFAEKMNSVSRDEWCRRFNIPPDARVIGTLGRLDRVKNHTFLLPVFELLAKKNSRYVLFIAGEGGMRTELEEDIKRRGLAERVFLPGHCSDVQALLSNLLDCFVLPSFAEGLPVSLLEATGAGLYSVYADTITRDIAKQFPDRMVSLPIQSRRYSETKLTAMWADAIEQAVQQKLSPQAGLSLVNDSPMNFRHFVAALVDMYEQANER